MSIDLRVITPELVPALLHVDAWGFGQSPQTDDGWTRLDLTAPSAHSTATRWSAPAETIRSI